MAKVAVRKSFALPWVDEFDRGNGALATYGGLIWNASDWTITSGAVSCAIGDAIALVNPGIATLHAQCDVTIPGGDKCGVVLNCNAGKTSYVLGYYDHATGKAVLEKYVSGVKTTLVNASAYYQVAQRVRVERRDATTYRLYYSGEQIETDQTIADAEIVNNTLYGLWSSATGNTILRCGLDDRTDPDFSIVWTSDNHAGVGMVNIATFAVNHMSAPRSVALFLNGGDAAAGPGEDLDWTNPDAQVAALVIGSLPFNFASGNHDYKTFPHTNDLPLVDWNPHLGSSVVTGTIYMTAGQAQNAYRIFTVGGQSFIVILVEHLPRAEVLAWVGSILAANLDKPAIIVSHTYLNATGEHSATQWATFKQYANVFLIVCGHIDTSPAMWFNETSGDNDNIINEMMWSEHTDGNWSLRILSFWTAQRRILVETYGTGFVHDIANEFWMRY